MNKLINLLYAEGIEIKKTNQGWSMKKYTRILFFTWSEHLFYYRWTEKPYYAKDEADANSMIKMATLKFEES